MTPRRSASWMTPALVVLLLVDLVLVTLALRPRGPGMEETSARPATTATTTASASTAPSASASPSPSASTAPPPQGVRLRRLIDATSATSAWRATTGACPDGTGVVEQTEDGGRTWTAVDAVMGEYVRLKADDDATAFVVGRQGDGCERTFLRTRDGGASWAASAASLQVAWHLDPADGSTVHAPRRTVDAPCDAEALDLAPVSSDEAGLLCSDGAVHTTEDGGGSWQAVEALPGAVALTDSPQGYVLAAVGVRGCAGVALLPVGGPSADSAGCLPVSAAPGEVAVSAADGSLWVWAHERVAVSQDGGRTWR